MAIKVFKNFSFSATLQGVLIVVVALVTLEVGSLLQYNQTKDIVEKDAYRRAQDNIDMVENEFNLMAELVESAVRNNMWSARALTTMPDSLWSLTRGIVADNPVVFGSAIALVENYNPRKSGHFFAPYAYRDGDKIKSVQVLVKVLANEQEAILPLQAVQGPYYNWADVKAYYGPIIRASKRKISTKEPLAALSVVDWGWQPVGDSKVEVACATINVFDSWQTISLARFPMKEYGISVVESGGPEAMITSEFGVKNKALLSRRLSRL